MGNFKELEQSLREELEQTGTKVVNGDMITYRTLLHEGDLPGDQAIEWWTQSDWDKHAKHVAELKAKGTYGKPWICDLTLKPFPEFDNPSPVLYNGPMESYRMIIIDFSK